MFAPACGNLSKIVPRVISQIKKVAIRQAFYYKNTTENAMAGVFLIFLATCLANKNLRAGFTLVRSMIGKIAPFS